jgi:hypothetical protein
MGAVDRNQEKVLMVALVGFVDEGARQKDPVLNADGLNIARSDTQECQRLARLGLLGLRAAMHFPVIGTQTYLRGMEVLLPGLGSDCLVEITGPLSLEEAISPRFLSIAPTRFQVFW